MTRCLTSRWPRRCSQQVASGQRGPVIRVYRPAPTVAFGRRDSFLAGFERAAAAATSAGFTPAIRSAGGRAAAYHEECLVIDEIVPARDAMADVDARFAAEAESQAQALRGLGIDARVGEVPGEYCPGRFSVNARGQTKLIGAAQRIISGAWLFSTVVVVGGARAGPCGARGVYAALGLDLGSGHRRRGRRRVARAPPSPRCRRPCSRLWRAATGSRPPR